MNNRHMILLGAIALLAGCQPASEAPPDHEANTSEGVAQADEIARRHSPGNEDKEAQNISRDETILLPSEAEESAGQPPLPTIPSGMGSDPAGSALRYKEKANAVTQHMKEQAEETERYMQR